MSAQIDHQRIEAFINEITRCFGAPPESITLRQGDKEMEYDNTNRGALFNERDKKTKDDDRDYAGTINVAGTEYWLSAWIKTSKKGTKFLSLSVKPKDASSSGGGSPKRDMNDEIPFAPEWR